VVDFKKKLDDLHWRKSLPKFWSDDFDTDLLKVFPDVHKLLGATIDIPIWTIGHTSYGRLNCPSQWNMPFGCFMWLDRPNYPRDKNGWINIGGCVTNDREVEGTWIEWLRDAWVHGQGWTLLPVGTTFSCVDYNRCFYPIMANIRGWEGYENIEHAYKMVRLWLVKANRRFAKAVERFRLGHDEYPYFAKGNVPALPVGQEES
jgi:hypothetical protein